MYPFAEQQVTNIMKSLFFGFNGIYSFIQFLPLKATVLSSVTRNLCGLNASL
jgi:hypothetical protein